MTKLVLALIASHALALPSCGEGLDAGFYGQPDGTKGSATAEDTTPSSADKDSPEAECPAPNSGQNASISWLSQFEEDLATNPSSVAVDAQDDAYLTTLTGGTRKLAADGTLVWSKPFGTLVAVSDTGDVVVSGSFTGTLTLDGTVLTSAGGSDVFVARLDANGNVVRAVALGGSGDETVTSLVVDHAGRAVVSGSGLGTVALDQTDAPAWRVDYFGALGTDAANDVLVTGALVGGTNFGGGTLTSAGGKDVFVVKLDQAGDHQWSARYGDAGANQLGQAIASDFDGDVFVAGVFDGSLDFGTGALALAHCPSEAWCNESGFVAKLDPTGVALWSVARGPMRAVAGLAATASGNVVVSGATPGDADPYRIPILFALDPTGQALWQRTEWPETGLGAGRGVAVGSCGSVLWSVGAEPTLDSNERAYLAKLTP
ncbi:MAG TPA: hypothetical protein VMI54_09760 [Polyangiaceae bacterium]|nr:hypothetical protein [Polyangiaceae bacterium]